MALENMRDVERTRQAYESGELRHPKKESYISNAGNYYLFGVDASRRREEIYKREAGLCAECGKWMREDSAYELDHIKGGYGAQRTWNPENLRILCGKCHKSKHVQVRLGTIPGIRGLER